MRGREALTRRTFLCAGAGGLLGAALAGGRVSRAAAGVGAPAEPKARSVIQLWMGGGPPQTDTFDPKPEAGPDYCGPYRKPIATNVDGIRICETMPRMAKQADKYAIIRSMTHPTNAHETATYIMMTGTLPSVELCYPAIGAVVALKRTEAGYRGDLPPYITLTNPLGRFSESGFLGSAHRTFATGGDPNAKEFRVQGLVPPRNMTQERIGERRGLLEALDRLSGRGAGSGPVDAMGAFRERAYGLILGDAREAFDLSSEPDPLRQKYGRHAFGQSCLLARRLVERGVPFITVNMGGWDTHRDHFKAMDRLLPMLDAGFAALLEDLAERGLLSTTVVMWYGEFGRTPKIANEPPWFGGRHHFSSCFSAVVAGGGFRGGAVVGASDPRGETVRERPVYPWDLSASLYKLLGIDPAGRLPHPQGCVAYVTPLGSGQVQSGGLLSEIM
ncbi:MAG: DUF1501 domain-containing protein [Planctomycetes bacterium]|nr:DUF1501 domain-containing protein [Planctomycetota bacterium]